MSETIAIISMLHEPANAHSANRHFHGELVLASTLARLARVSRIKSAFILCWDDHSPAVAEVIRTTQTLLATRNDSTALTAGSQLATSLNIACKGRRQSIAHLDALAAAGRWLDGWRGGLLQCCDFDIGFHGKWVVELVGTQDALLIDPAAALIHTDLLEKVLDRAEDRPDLDMVFTQAAPGLCGVLVKNSLLVQLANADQHPGKLLHYLPERPSRDPIAGEACVEVPTGMARTTKHFKLNSRRQIEQLEANLSPPLVLGGRARVGAKSDRAAQAESIVEENRWPREVSLELTTRRSTFPSFGAARHFPINRPDLSLEQARSLFRELSEIDDLRLTLGGVGDPLCHPAFFEIIESARAAGIAAIHVETDLYEVDTAQVAGLVEAGIDILSVNLPAITPGTYHKLMGINGYETVIHNIKQLILRRQGLSRGTPIVVPTFVKCRDNFSEMEPWYDQWLRVLGTAVIAGPSTCSNDNEISVADMTPPKRKPCARLARRMTILSDGQFVSCDHDIFARQLLGKIGKDSVQRIWNSKASALRVHHAQSQWEKHPLCATCKEWHRP